MSDLLNYLPCPKCLNHSSNLVNLEIKKTEANEELVLKLSCIKNCSTNWISFSNLKKYLDNQEKVPLSLLIYGKFSKEQNIIENNSSKIFNKLDKLYFEIEKTEKEIIKMKEIIKDEIFKYKKYFEDLKLLNELIYGAYLKNNKDNIEQDNVLNLNNNLKLIYINDKDNFNIENNFYIKEIEKDIILINSSINYIKKEIKFFLNNNKIISVNKTNNSNIDLFHQVNFSNSIHNEIETYRTSLKNIETILKLSDGNIAIGSYEEMVIYNLELNKEILKLPGNFSDISEIKYNKKYKSNNNIIILSVQNKSIKIYDIYNKNLLLNYSQFYQIDGILELYNGDILYIVDFCIFNINLKEEFKIYFKYFCFSMINLYDQQNVLGYGNLSEIKFVYLDNPRRKAFKEIKVKDSKEIYDLKQVYDEKLGNNYLLVLSNLFLDVYDFNTDQFKYKAILNKTSFYKKIFISETNNNILNFNLIAENSIQLFNIKKDNLILIHTIESLKKIVTSLYCKIRSTPFGVNNDGKYILIFDSNEEGFNLL